jgi:hypothetical protein
MGSFPISDWLDVDMLLRMTCAVFFFIAMPVESASRDPGRARSC